MVSNWDSDSMIGPAASFLSRTSHRSSNNHHGHISSSNARKSHRRHRSKSRASSTSRSRSRSKQRKASSSGFSSFFDFPSATRSGVGVSSSSHHKRSPRPGFIRRGWKKLKKLFRELVRFAKKHPIKVFMIVLLPLLTGGALSKLLERFGVRLPSSLQRLVGMSSRVAAAGESLGLVTEVVRFVTGKKDAYTPSSAVKSAGWSGTALREMRAWDDGDEDILARGVRTLSSKLVGGNSSGGRGGDDWWDYGSSTESRSRHRRRNSDDDGGWIGMAKRFFDD